MVDLMDIHQLRNRYRRGAQGRALEAYNQRLHYLSLIEDNLATQRTLSRLIRVKTQARDIYAESDEVKDGTIESANMYTFENVIDIAGTVADETVAGVSSNSSQGQKNLLDLANFLERPIPITTFQIAVGTNTSVKLDVWDLFTLEPSVRAKLRNFAYLRGNLHVRVAISGTPFHYGRLMTSYQPWPLKNENLVYNHVNLSQEPLLYRFNFLNYLSQAPGATCVDVRDNQPVDVMCPYISTKPMHRLFNTSALALAATTSYEDIQNAGSLYIYSVAPLGCINATPSEVSVNIYAWMTDVELGTQTATQIDITTESDEFETGPVEKISSRLATYASYFTQIPVIGPYATASKIALGSLSKISAIFGWSRPVVIQDAMIVKNNPFQNGANVIGSETSTRITLDPKQELTVDPRVMGDGKDEMTISHLCSVESLLTTFQWNDDSAVMADPIFKCAVNPNLTTFVPVAATTYVQPSALSFATTPFQYWRGDITFRFDIICSAYHRGKLAVFFEPNVNQTTLINADIATNKQYMRIIDIQQTQSVEIDVKWAHPRAWARTLTAAESLLTHGSSFNLAGLQDFCNGYIGVVPFTTLQSPDNSDISVNVFVYSKEMHVNYLSASKFPSARDFITESEFVTESDLTFSKEVSTIELNPSSATVDTISQEHFGEEPFSFRSLCKRYACTFSETSVTTPAILTSSRFFGVTMPGPVLKYGDTSATDFTSLISYLRYAYVGVRGGVRKRIQFYGVTGGFNNAVTVKMRFPETSIIAALDSSSSAGNHKYGIGGVVRFVPSGNAGIEFELPYYSNNLFSYSFSRDDVGATVDGLDESTWLRRYNVFYEMLVGDSDITVIENSATGEDFTFLRYQGAPYFTLS